MAESPKNSGIPLAKVIQDLRQQLLDAVSEGDGKALRFKLAPVELEFQTALNWSGKADAKVEFWVVKFGAEGSLQNTTTHKIKLVLEPVTGEGAPVQVTDTGRGE